MIKERMIEFIDSKGIVKERFYEMIGMTSANFRGPARNSPINSNAIKKMLEKFPDLNLYWLITGKEQMIRNIEEQTSCDEIKIIAKERAYIIDLQKDKIEMQTKLIEDLELNLQKFKNYNEKISEPREYELFDDVVKRIKNNEK